MVVTDAVDPMDATVVEELYRQLFPSLKRLAYLMVGSDAAAEDLVHDAFVASARRLPTLDDPAVYLRTVVINGARRSLRRASRQPTLRFVDESSPPPSSDAIAVRTALATMSPRRRIAVVLRYFGDLTHDEIAAAIGCRPSTARSLVRRGLIDLKEVLGER